MISASTAAALGGLLFALPAIASASPVRAGSSGRPAAAHHVTASHYQVKPVLDGMKLRHSFVPAGGGKRRSEPLTLPDDITVLGDDLFTAFQNGVGSQGEPSTDGNTDSTVVEFTPSGHVVAKWDIKGKCDGLTADPGRDRLIATVNEDANSSIYTITPAAHTGAQVQHYRYNKPLPSKGGTDAISIYDGRVIVSASAPGTTGKPAPQPTYPALYAVSFDRATHVATIAPLFSDEAPATVANTGAGHGKVVRLALTDPDSNAVVPESAPRFAGDFELTSQGDKEQIYVQRGDAARGADSGRLAVLRLSRSVDDTAWATSRLGALFGSDTSGDTVDAVLGVFPEHAVFVAATPCDANNAPSTCPGPGFPANFLGMLNPFTGHISRVSLTGPKFEPQGLLFVGA